MEGYWIWIQNHLLQIGIGGLSLVFMYLYALDRGQGVKLSGHYRNSIFEAQSKVFLNATQYLISGRKDLAIKEFLNAVNLNQETVETYFALGGLFRSNGEIDKAISIHRSLMARENLSESHRLRALKELAIDFDKGGFMDRAVETYKDVLKINRDQTEVISSLCEIYENIEDWEQAYHYRVLLSKTGRESQQETISHILVQMAKKKLREGNIQACSEILEDAFQQGPSVSAKILKLNLYVYYGALDNAQNLLLEILKEHPMYTSFVFESLLLYKNEEEKKAYLVRLDILKDFFLNLEDMELLKNPSVLLTKVRLHKEKGELDRAYKILRGLIKEEKIQDNSVNIEFVNVLVAVGKKDEAMERSIELIKNMNQSLSKYYCGLCGQNSDEIFWRCPRCHKWETILFRWKV